MLTIRIFGDKQDEKFTWSIVVVDSRRTLLQTDGVDDSEEDAKAGMLAALGELVKKLEFSPVRQGEDRENSTGLRDV